MCFNNLFIVEIHLDIKIAPHRDYIDLECNYELKEAIYSIKFYHNEIEFYRFTPRDIYPVLIFAKKGLNIVQTPKYHNYIRLLMPDKDTDGMFRCEISTEGPVFETFMDEKEWCLEGTKRIGFINKIDHLISLLNFRNNSHHQKRTSWNTSDNF